VLVAFTLAGKRKKLVFLNGIPLGKKIAKKNN
jgi:hypothetical protein